jgi:hypothetical protein
MRWILLALFGTACLISPVGYGQNPPSDNEVFKKLEKHGIFPGPIGPFGKGTVALHCTINLADSETLKALRLLRHVRELTEIHIFVAEPKHMEECLKLIGELPKIKVLHLEADRFPDKDLKIIAAFKQLEDLSLGFPDVTDEQIRELHALKDLKTLKRLYVLYAQASPKVLEDLKDALKQVKEVTFEKDLRIQLLKISPKDDPITKLQKEKFNAAASELNLRLDFSRSGKGRMSDPSALGALQRLRDAALDVSDQELKLKVVNHYVEFMESAYKEIDERFKAAIGGSPEHFHQLRYYYLDAQILQLRLKKQFEAK